MVVSPPKSMVPTKRSPVAGSRAMDAPMPPGSVPNYLVQSILVTLCCCQIPGIVAIVYAAQVNGLIRAGDFVAARRSSRLAFIWSLVGFCLGLGFGLLYGVLVLIGALADA